ncbi:MAG: hypothetical protein ACP6IY_09540 [Promethearchaeia archaeon]
MRKYTIQGIMEYANCVTREIEAKNKIEALKKFREMENEFIDPAITEFQYLHVELEDVEYIEKVNDALSQNQEQENKK